MALKKSKQTNSDLLSCKSASATTQAVKRIRERTKPLLNDRGEKTRNRTQVGSWGAPTGKTESRRAPGARGRTAAGSGMEKYSIPRIFIYIAKILWAKKLCIGKRS
jgi:hypothetical protein